MTVNPTQLDEVVQHARAQLAAGWQPCPGGYPNAIELALIDAVFSIRARYGRPADPGGQRKATGVYAVVKAWKGRPDADGYDDLQHILDVDATVLRQLLGNSSRTSGMLKSDAVRQAAAGMVKAGIRTSSDLAANRLAAKAAYVGVRGLGGVTFSYLCMLLGIPDVKADTWIIRFVSEAISAPVTADQAYALVHAAARHFAESGDASMPHNPAHLDHALWAAQRARARAA